MTNTRQDPPTPDFNKTLLDDLKTLLEKAETKGSRANTELKLDAYWKSGKRIFDLKNTTRARLKALAQQLDVPYILIQRCRRFYKIWPAGLPRQAGQLTWSQHVDLLGVGDKKTRLFYLNLAIENGWSGPSLKNAIRQNAFDQAQANTFLPSKTPTFDHPLYVFKARLLRVIDGDTLLVLIELGFQMFIEARLRLRGINTAELGPKARRNASALAAREFVVRELSACPFLVIQTHKADTYGRYVADVYYHPTLTNKEDVCHKGFCLNQKLIEAGLAKPMLV